MSFFIFFKNGNSFSQDSKYLSFTTHIYFLLQCFLQWKKQTFVTELNIKNTYFYHNLQHKHRYFLIRFAQTKITLFIFVNNWIIRENESFLIVEPCSRVTCCVEIKLQYFFRKYIFICAIYTLLMQLISAILCDTC